MLFYMSEEAQEGSDAYVEKRRPDFPASPVARDATGSLGSSTPDGHHREWVAAARVRARFRPRSRRSLVGVAVARRATVA